MTFIPQQQEKHCFIACSEDKVNAGLCDCINRMRNQALPQPLVSGSLQYREPLCLTVKYALAFEFRALVERMQDCKVKNVIEIKSGELLQYWIECPKEKENEITDMAFMTWIKNPVFQKYYHDTRAFQEIAEKYVSERCKQ
jgi:hypothetical protein